MLSPDPNSHSAIVKECWIFKTTCKVTLPNFFHLWSISCGLRAVSNAATIVTRARNSCEAGQKLVLATKLQQPSRRSTSIVFTFLVLEGELVLKSISKLKEVYNYLISIFPRVMNWNCHCLVISCQCVRMWVIAVHGEPGQKQHGEACLSQSSHVLREKIPRTSNSSSALMC